MLLQCNYFVFLISSFVFISGSALSCSQRSKMPSFTLTKATQSSLTADSCQSATLDLRAVRQLVVVAAAAAAVVVVVVVVLPVATSLLPPSLSRSPALRLRLSQILSPTQLLKSQVRMNEKKKLLASDWCMSASSCTHIVIDGAFVGDIHSCLLLSSSSL